MSTSASTARGPLAGLVTIITGASSGIGAETARELARQGAIVVLAARRAPELAQNVQAIIAAGGKAEGVATDVADPAQLQALIAHVETTYGRIDVLVSNAGIGGPLFVKADDDDLARIVDVNLLATMRLARLVVPGMRARGHGHIIAVASVAGHVATSALYSGTKFGLRGFCLSLRRELLGTGVTVSLISPGFIRTDMTSQRRARFPGPALVARAIARLIRSGRREVVVPWYYRVAIALEHLLPWAADGVLRPRPRRKHTGGHDGHDE